MSTTIKISYTVVMLFALFIVMGGKFPAFGRMFLADEPVEYVNGDQYRMCDLELFREDIPLTRASATAPLEQAEVITLGDSFFKSALGSDLFANQLAARLGLKVHNMETAEFFEPQSYPLSYLESIGYRGGKSRILVLETVERSILERAATYNKAGASTSNDLDAFAFKVLKNNDVEYFFKHNVLVYPAMKWLKNLRFQQLGIVDKSIGAYSLEPKMLFYQRDLEFSREKKSDAVVEATADSIVRLAATLKERYDLELIYLPIPNKYSVYHGLVANGYSYDGFIPRLCQALTRRGVNNLDAYTLYSRHNKPGMPLLYFGSDTHYTGHGKALLAAACAELIGKVRQADATGTLAAGLKAAPGPGTKEP